MEQSLDISIHCPQRIAIIERLVHLCRYSPGMVLFDGEAGRSPLKFLRHMADLLKDELDFALLEESQVNTSTLIKSLLSQWFIYRENPDRHNDIQSVHHFLDLGLQSGRLALIVVGRTSVLDSDATNCLVGMMARHSQLTVLFAGIVDARILNQRAHEMEVSVNYIELHDSSAPNRPSPSYQPDFLCDSRFLNDSDSENLGKSLNVDCPVSAFDHAFSDESYELSENEADEFFESDFPLDEVSGRREPSLNLQKNTGQDFDVNESDFFCYFACQSQKTACTKLGAINLG